MLLNNQVITEEIKEKIKKYLETNDNETTTIPSDTKENKFPPKTTLYIGTVEHRNQEVLKADKR